jgi:hypothetical protein
VTGRAQGGRERANLASQVSVEEGDLGGLEVVLSL